MPIPARTAFTTACALSNVHFHPGFAFVTGTGCACAPRRVMAALAHNAGIASIRVIARNRGGDWIDLAAGNG